MATNQLVHVLVTDDNQGPILAICAWFLMTVMILAVIARVTIKVAVRRELKIEDFSVMGALLFGVAQSIAVSVAIQNGLGQRQANLSPASLIIIEKAQYVADLMYILTVALAKVSVLQLLRAISVREILRKVTLGSIWLSVLWALPAFFTLAFQCGPSQPWAISTGQCINKLAFWIALSPIDILTEFVVILLPLWMMVPVRVAFSKKVTVVVAFVFRFVVIIITTIRLFLLRSYLKSDDMIFNSIASGIASQCLLSMTITTACIPVLKPFLDSFESGALNIKLKQASNFNGNSYEMKNSSNGNKTALRSRNRNGEGGGGYLAAITGKGMRVTQDETGSLDSGKSDAMIIKRTDQWDIRYESAKASSLDPRKDVEDGL